MSPEFRTDIETPVYANPRYLDAKRTVDDRAVNRAVLDRFRSAVWAIDGPVRLIEIGAGTGTMVVRLAARDVLPPRTEYVAVEADPALACVARDRLPERLESLGYTVGTRDGRLVCTADGTRLAVTVRADDAFEVVDDLDPPVHGLIACSFLDLFPLSRAVRTLARGLRRGGLLYAPITYDGMTRFRPGTSYALDTLVEQRYHRAMANADRSGSRAGRDLPEAIVAAGGAVLLAGRSDWRVEPEADGYPGDEAFFLDRILETVRIALDADPAIPTDRLAAWTARRRRHLETGRLAYQARNRDVLARFPG